MVYKKKVIELQRAIVRAWTTRRMFFYIQKDQAFSYIEWHVFHANWRKNKQVHESDKKG
jgi:hypothetical protein